MSSVKSHKSILIVGGGNGIGQSIVRSILSTSTTTKIVVFDRDASALDDLIHPTRQPDLRARINCIVGDVRDSRDRASILRKSLEFMQGVDTLIYCAGVITPIERIENVDLEGVKKAFDINVFGCMAVVQLCLEHLRHSRVAHPTNSGFGKVLILSSACDDEVTYHGWMPYCTTKAALTRFISCLAHEEPLITVQGVYPKLTRTKMPEDIIAGRYKGVMADHEIERFRVWDDIGDEMVEPAEWCGKAVAKLALGLYEGGRSGETLYYDEHVPSKIVGT